MKLKIIIALMLIGFTAQQCSIGCLVCSTSNQCTLCDSTNNYYLNGTACVVSSKTNCLILRQDGTCTVCNQNYYLDLTTLNCLAVPAAKIVTNCNYYDSTQVCSGCASGFIISGGKCTAVTKAIANCNAYTQNGDCLGCSSGFIPSSDLTTCVMAPTNLNCLYYDFINCKQCKPGFIKNPNYYFTFLTQPVYAYQYLQYTVLQSYAWFAAITCQEITATNCATNSAFDVCTQCNAGYYLQSGTCMALPSPPIPGCLSYDSLTKCIECQTGWFLSENACQTNVLIPNCMTFNGAASTTTCTKCNANFFLSTNACSLRIASFNIQNCLSQTVDADTCDMCVSNFVLTTDKLACLPAVANCNQYASNNAQSTLLSCISCTNGFYLTNSGSANVCTAGTVTGCQTYTSNSNNCIVCNNGYYLNSALNTCTLHVTIQNCLTYSPNIANTCTVCNTGFYNFAYSGVCVSVTPITGCATYSATGTVCSGCNSGYYLNGGSCTIIPLGNTNCNVYTSIGCTACNAGYALNTQLSANTCIIPPDYINSAINSPCFLLFNDGKPLVWGTASSSQTQFRCLVCSNNMYGYTPQRSEAICVNTSQLNLYTGFTATPNCVRYGYNYAMTKKIVCMECGGPNPYIITGYRTMGPLADSTTCGQCIAPPTHTAAIVLNDLLGFVNICIDSTSSNPIVSDPNCQTYARFASKKLTMSTAITGLIDDYKCVFPNLAAASSTKNYLALNLPTTDGLSSPTISGTTFYTLDIPSPTSFMAPTDFNHGFSNTADLGSVFPNVFNYKGILKDISSLNIPNSNMLVVTGTNQHLNNCDIVVKYPGASSASYAFKGFAYIPDSDSVLYTPALSSNINGYNSCFRCTFNYQLTYMAIAKGVNSPFPSCELMGTSCANPGIVYGGLTTFLNSVFSCHSCAPIHNQPAFPSIYFETAVGSGVNSAGIWTGWTVSNVYTSVNTVSPNHGFRCALAPAVTVLSTSVSGCAAYGYIQQIATFPVLGTTTSTFRNVCLACGASNYPTYVIETTPVTTTETGFKNLGESLGIVPAFVVKTCTPSLNCDMKMKTQFNTCGACNTGTVLSGVLVYYAYMDYALTNCYQSNTPNCFILQTEPFPNTSTANVCAICMAGYFLNLDKVCEKYTVPNQLANAKFVYAYYTYQVFTSTTPANTFPSSPLPPSHDLTIVKVAYLLSWNQLPYGVSGCSTGYTKFPPSELVMDVCVLSSYITNNFANLPSTSKYVPNCLRYAITLLKTKPDCGGCANPYILSHDMTANTYSCVSSSPFPNCLEAEVDGGVSRCSECLTNYFNVNGVCVNTQIGNCAAYKNTVIFNNAFQTLQCNTCASGFVLSADFLSCTKGKILNCKTYTQGNAGTCEACLSGFFLVGIPNNGFYCYSIAASLNCLEMKSIPAELGSNLALISCKTCKTGNSSIYGTQSWNAIASTNQAQTLCMPFSPIPNCQVYDQANATLTFNKFSCTQCSSGYWSSADTLTCVQRVYTPTQCAVYSATSDVCTKCSTGFFLSTNGQQCIAFPTGIFGCSLYSSATVCTQCSSGYFLSNNTCVASSLTISNCQVYSANSVCSQCAPGFFLGGPIICTTPTAVNCLTYNSITACATCASNFGLQTSNGVTSCVAIAVANCATPTTVAPFICMVCNGGYYANSAGVCMAVTQIIANCLTYDSAMTCSVCSSSSVLNVAKTVCNSIDYAGVLDVNCAQSNLLASPVCATCMLGSFFQNGVCTSCTENTLASGCWSCNPVNQKVCLMCMPTYFMNSKGVCTPVNPTPPPRNTTKTVSVNKALALSVIMATLYFDQL